MTRITPEQVMPLLVAACPSYVRDPDLAGSLYVELGAFAQHLVSLLRGGATDELAAALAVVERLHTDGDPAVQEAATIGLLEGIQNAAGHARVDAWRFTRWLGPESLRWWRGLDAFWSGRAPAVLPVDDP